MERFVSKFCDGIKVESVGNILWICHFKIFDGGTVIIDIIDANHAVSKVPIVLSKALC